MKRTLIAIFLLSSICSQAQKKAVIGFGFNVSDFETPAQIEQSSFKNVWKSGDFNKGDRLNYGFSLLYWKALSRHIDISGRYNGIFGVSEFSSKNKEQKDYFNELEASFHARAFSDEKLLNPFISAGAGIGNYWTKSKVAGYAPVGIGLQVNLMQETYIYLQGNYRLSFDKSVLPNNLFYSFGITQSLHSPKAPKPITPPVIENNDRDNDGVANAVDACPDVAGTVNGCPDGDKDGVADKDDKCPAVAGLQKYEGCPIPDTDNDGVNDEEDKCVDVAGVARYQGCPVPDTDKDGVNDENDKCPTVAGEASNNGCPVIKEEVIQKVNIAAKSILFVTGKDVIEKKSHVQLNRLWFKWDILAPGIAAFLINGILGVFLSYAEVVH